MRRLLARLARRAILGRSCWTPPGILDNFALFDARCVSFHAYHDVT